MTMTDTTEPPTLTEVIQGITDLKAAITQLQRDVGLLQTDVASLKTATVDQQSTLHLVQNALLTMPCPEYAEYTVGSCPNCDCALGPAVGDVGEALVAEQPPSNVVP